jgi:hypothetical protein
MFKLIGKEEVKRMIGHGSGSVPKWNRDFFYYNTQTVSKQREPSIYRMTEPLYQEMKNGQNVKLTANLCFLVFVKDVCSLGNVYSIK